MKSRPLSANDAKTALTVVLSTLPVKSKYQRILESCLRDFNVKAQAQLQRTKWHSFQLCGCYSQHTDLTHSYDNRQTNNDNQARTHLDKRREVSPETDIRNQFRPLLLLVIFVKNYSNSKVKNQENKEPRKQCLYIINLSFTRNIFKPLT